MFLGQPPASTPALRMADRPTSSRSHGSRGKEYVRLDSLQGGPGPALDSVRRAADRDILSFRPTEALLGAACPTSEGVRSPRGPRMQNRRDATRIRPFSLDNARG